MARLKVYAVRDLGIEAFGQLICVPAPGAATRSFCDEVRRAGSPMNSHPEDYELYFIAEYEDSDGLLVPVDRPRRVCSARDFVDKE